MGERRLQRQAARGRERCSPGALPIDSSTDPGPTELPTIVHGGTQVGRAVNSASNRTCLIVLGMHRSGTSAITGTLGLLGAKLPRKMLGPVSSNPKGHFESTRILRVNDQMLHALGSAWYDFRAISVAALEHPAADKFKSQLSRVLQDNFKGASLFTLKDPRFCKLLPLVRSAIENSGASVRVVFCFRNPLDVAKSLYSRDGISVPHGLSLWLRYMLDAEYYSRHMPRVFIHYPDFVNDWRAAVDKIESQLQIFFAGRYAAAAKIDDFLDAKLRHHATATQEVEELWRQLNWFGPCWKSIYDLERDPKDDRAMKQLDLISGSFVEPANFFGLAAKEYYAERLRLRGELAQCEAVENRLLATTKELEDLRLELQSAKSELQDSKSKLKVEKAGLVELKRKNLDLKKKLHSVLGSPFWRVTAPLRVALTYVRKSRPISHVREVSRKH
jgi:hypothetical protein